MIKQYRFAIISAAGRDERKVICHSAMQANEIAARILPEHPGGFVIFCTPVPLQRGGHASR